MIRRLISARVPPTTPPTMADVRAVRTDVPFGLVASVGTTVVNVVGVPLMLDTTVTTMLVTPEVVVPGSELALGSCDWVGVGADVVTGDAVELPEGAVVAVKAGADDEFKFVRDEKRDADEEDRVFCGVVLRVADCVKVALAVAVPEADV